MYGRLEKRTGEETRRKTSGELDAPLLKCQIRVSPNGRPVDQSRSLLAAKGLSCTSLSDQSSSTGWCCVFYRFHTGDDKALSGDRYT